MRRAATLLLAMFTLTAAAATQASTMVVVVGGLGGEQDYDERFAAWVDGVAAASASVAGGPARVVKLSGDAARREAIEAALRPAGQLAAGDSFVLVLIGHGSHDGTEYRFNIPGPDITGTQILALLDRIPATVPQLVVNATSSSGAVVDSWARPHRAVITATRSGGERNATRFGGFWAEALATDDADRDKDGVVTAQEAYDFANRRVVDAFKGDAAIATEHARTAGGDPAHFVVARLGDAALFANDQELAALREQQGQVEARLETLRAQKTTLPEDQYYDRLEPVLVDMARLGVRIDARIAALGGQGAKR